jgi:UDPglucose 6-dehydrogenase
MQVSVVGTGYVGLVTSVVLADLGNKVVCVDKDQAKVDLIRSGKSPIYEPGLEEMLQRVLAAGRLTIISSISEAVKESSVVFICVGTPPDENGFPDMTAVKAVAREIGRSVEKPIVVVNKSTVPVGSGDLVEQVMLEAGADPTLISVASCPEFLREGSAIQDTLHPDRVVIGARNKDAAETVARIFEPLGAPIFLTDLNSAELIKYGSNAFLAMKISFINAMSRVCELAGADVGEVAKGMGMDRRIGSQFLQAGLGWGGSCFPKDVQGLIKTSETLGYDFALLKEVESVNEAQTQRFVDRLEARIGGFAGKKIALWGLSFKPNTDDIRDSKALAIATRLLVSGAEVHAYDPAAMDDVRRIMPNITLVESGLAAAQGADALILATEWNEFIQTDMTALASAMKAPIVFDGRRVYSKTAAAAAGIELHTIGSPS